VKLIVTGKKLEVFFQPVSKETEAQLLPGVHSSKKDEGHKIKDQNEGNIYGTMKGVEILFFLLTACCFYQNAAAIRQSARPNRNLRGRRQLKMSGKTTEGKTSAKESSGGMSDKKRRSKGFSTFEPTFVEDTMEPILTWNPSTIQTGAPKMSSKNKISKAAKSKASKEAKERKGSKRKGSKGRSNRLPTFAPTSEETMDGPTQTMAPTDNDIVTIAVPVPGIDAVEIQLNDPDELARTTEGDLGVDEEEVIIMDTEDEETEAVDEPVVVDESDQEDNTEIAEVVRTGDAESVLLSPESTPETVAPEAVALANTDTMQDDNTPNAILTNEITDNAETDATVTVVTINSGLTFEFFDGEGATTPSNEEIDGLVAETKTFFSDALARDLGDDFKEFDMLGITTDYQDGATPITFTMSFTTEVDLDLNTNQTPHAVALLMKESNFNEYISAYVWSAEPWSRNECHETHAVEFTATGSGARRQ